MLGEGEFGKVISVTDKTGKVTTPLAMKQLSKGFQWKDNTLYNPMSPEVLRTEVGCLRKLGGKRYNLKLESLYEAPAFLAEEIPRDAEATRWRFHIVRQQIDSWQFCGCGSKRHFSFVSMSGMRNNLLHFYTLVQKRARDKVHACGERQ